jgi:hypothetical protein
MVEVRQMAAQVEMLQLQAQVAAVVVDVILLDHGSLEAMDSGCLATTQLEVKQLVVLPQDKQALMELPWEPIFTQAVVVAAELATQLAMEAQVAQEDSTAAEVAAEVAVDGIPALADLPIRLVQAATELTESSS